MDAIFAYVLNQFYAVYQPDQPFDIHYGLNGSSRIQIRRTDSGFFERTAPFPTQVPIYYPWHDRPVPFWFDQPLGNEVLSINENQAIIQADIIAAAFYFLSGWQEYYSPIRDKYGRFPYAESLQYRYQLITVPLVNYYFDILKTAIERVYRVKLRPVFARGAPFATCLTHDVDNCESAWLLEGRDAIRSGNWPVFFKVLRQKLSGRDNWANVPEVMAEVRKYGVRSSFFFLASNRKFRGIANADYDITRRRYRHWLSLLQENNFEIGIHGSHITALETGRLPVEIQRLKTPVQGNRFHYLRFEPKHTPHLLDAAGLVYDTTLGFSEHYGFRHGTCFPFQLFNFKTRQAFRFREIPLHLMDATLHHPHYLQLPLPAIVPAITPMLQEIKKFGGCFTWLWHNENFSRYNHQNGPAAFHQIMQYLLGQEAAFLTTGQVNGLLENTRGL